jgi:DNA excision repair protein ERCC-2
MRYDHMDFFPYPIRPIQNDIMEAIDEVISRQGDVVIEAGTGSGKTVSALAPAISAAYGLGKRILYLTRTNSQQKQVVEEFRRIVEKAKEVSTSNEPDVIDAPDAVDQIIKELNDERAGKVDGKTHIDQLGSEIKTGSAWEGGPSGAICVALQGRNNMCPLTSEEPEFINGSPEELSKMCSERKRHTTNRLNGKPSGGKECSYYSAFMLDDGMEIKRWARGSAPTAEELIERSLEQGICPYEVTKAMVSEAVLVAAPYIFFLSPFIRRRLLDWMECSINDLIVIVDEAHNLASFARDLSSITLSTGSLKLAMAEVQLLGDHDIGGGRTIRGFIETFGEAMDELSQEFLIDEDGLVPPSALVETMMLLFRTNSINISAMASEMLQHGAAIQDRKKAEGKLPRSYVHRVALFYKVWNELEFERYTPLVVKGRREGELILEAFAMDPSIVTSSLGEAFASVHLSGTLSPLTEYRDTIGLPPDTPLLSLPPPFPRSNRSVVFVPDLSTNYEQMMKDPGIRGRYRQRIISILGSIPDRNTAVFFPSFDLLNDVMGRVELEDGSILPPSIEEERPFYIEERGCSQYDVMDMADKFKNSLGGVLVSVIGGRLSEGMDFPGTSLEMVVIVGIPYPKPNARQRALSSYYDIKFRKGWEYTVHAPASRRLQQAIGRMIRSENERGFAVILDKRAHHFKLDIPDLEETGDALENARRFFHGKT